MAQSPSQIIEARKRALRTFGQHDIQFFRGQWERAGETAQDFMDFIPIRLVTFLETDIRRIVADAVNSGDPFAKNGIEMIARWSGRTIAEALRAIHTKQLTLGELVSHGFSTGRMDEILATLKTLFGESIHSELAASTERWSEDFEAGVEQAPLILDLTETIKHLDRLLQVRHILVHERPRNKPYQNSEIGIFFNHVHQFISALDWVLIGRLYGMVPRTQTGLNIEAGRRAEAVQNELDKLRGGKAADFENPQTPEMELEYHWDRFCMLSAQRVAGYLESGHPGTIAPLLAATEREQLSQWRLDRLRQETQVET